MSGVRTLRELIAEFEIPEDAEATAKAKLQPAHTGEALAGESEVAS